MIGHCILETEATEPAVRQVEVHFLAQAPFRADAEAVAEQQHPHHQLRIDRGATRVAIERREVLAEIGEIEEPINAAQQVVCWNVRVEVEGIKQIGCAINMSESQNNFKFKGCALGEHNHILVEEFAFSEDEMQQLKANGVFGKPYQENK